MENDEVFLEEKSPTKRCQPVKKTQMGTISICGQEQIFSYKRGLQVFFFF